jgi:hypothetical protein
MNEIKYTGGPAFPAEIYVNPDVSHYTEGMTLRDYFAAHWLTNKYSSMGGYTALDYKATAEIAYKVADEMLKARDA